MTDAIRSWDSRTASLTGSRFSRRAFAAIECDRLQGEAAVDVLEGRRAAAIFRGAVGPGDCGQLKANFWNHPLRYTRGADAPAEYVGVFHYNKDLDSYLKEAAQAERELDRLFGAGVNPQQAFLDELRRPVAGLGEGQVRVAEHRGRKASRFVMRSWTTRKQFSLLPHEDAAQCRSHKQAGFEIQRAARNAIMSVNICVENSGGGGLRIWNIQPDDASRRRLGLDETGSPYPLESLDGHDSQLIDVRPGDMYCFNAKTVHAVEAMRGAQNRRATIAFLMARLDPATVLYWA